MHMSDALISPAVGVTLLAVAGTGIVLSGRYLSKDNGTNTMNQNYLVPLMGVLGAFIFAAQMINFTIPGTGSSGHLGGGILLAILLGPAAGFIVIASVLLMQALLFADGGLLAYGANLVNMGLIPCFVIYPLIWKPLTRHAPSKQRILAVSVFCGILAMLVGAVGVTLETAVSGITELPFAAFLSLMTTVHFFIGIGEGLITGAVVWFALQQNYRLPSLAINNEGFNGNRQAITTPRRLIISLGIIAALVAGGLSLYASENPDGLEWAIDRMGATESLEAAANTNTPLHQSSQALQETTGIMPDYGFAEDSTVSSGAWQTTVAGLFGILMTLLCAMGLAKLFRAGSRQSPTPKGSH